MRQNYHMSNAFLFVDYNYNNSQYNNYYTAVSSRNCATTIQLIM